MQLPVQQNSPFVFSFVHGILVSEIVDNCETLYRTLCEVPVRKYFLTGVSQLPMSMSLGKELTYGK